MRAQLPLRILSWPIDGAGRRPFLPRRRSFPERRQRIVEWCSAKTQTVDFLFLHNLREDFAKEVAELVPHLELAGICPSPSGSGVSSAYRRVDSLWTSEPADLFGLRLNLKATKRTEDGSKEVELSVLVHALDNHLVHQTWSRLSNSKDPKSPASPTCPMKRHSNSHRQALVEAMQLPLKIATGTASSSASVLPSVEDVFHSEFRSSKELTEEDQVGEVTSLAPHGMSPVRDLIDQWFLRAEGDIDQLPHLLLGDLRVAADVMRLGPYDDAADTNQPGRLPKHTEVSSIMKYWDEHSSKIRAEERRVLMQEMGHRALDSYDTPALIGDGSAFSDMVADGSTQVRVPMWRTRHQRFMIRSAARKFARYRVTQLRSRCPLNEVELARRSPRDVEADLQYAELSDQFPVVLDSLVVGTA